MSIRLRPVPIVKMLAVSLVTAWCIVFLFENFSASPWGMAILVHIPQFIIPFTVILYVSHGQPSRYGFNLREDTPEFTHRRMLYIGLISGLLMSLNYLINIVRGLPLSIPKPVTPFDVAGNLVFQWIIVGLSEETMFRGLIQTYLMKNLEGYLEIHGSRLHVGTVIAAIFWGGFHIINYLNMPLGSAVLSVLVTIPIGLLMGYAYQRTGSLLTTILVHNCLFGVHLTVGYILFFMGF